MNLMSPRQRRESVRGIGLFIGSVGLKRLFTKSEWKSCCGTCIKLDIRQMMNS